jgi:electron transfer flavoprotein beta subunit
MMDHIVVCVKSVLMNAPVGKALRSVDSCALNPFDRVAVEMALQMKAESGAQVTALSMGPDSCAFALCDAMAMGADRGVLVSDPLLAGSDTHATASTLAAAIQKLSPFDMVLFGVRTADSDTGQVGPQTSVLLDLPMVTWAYAVEAMDTGLRVERRTDGFHEMFELSIPATLTIHPRSVQPRDPDLASIEAAFERQTLQKWRLADLGVSPDSVGEKGSPTWVASLSRVSKERKCEFITGEPDIQASSLVRRLLDRGLIG